jgi:hypothetical protein
MQILQHLKGVNLVGMDVVEVAPQYDVGDITSLGCGDSGITATLPLRPGARVSGVMTQATDREVKETLERKGHYAIHWEDLDKIELPTGVISSMYRVGDPDPPGIAHRIQSVLSPRVARLRRTPTIAITRKLFWKVHSGSVQPGIRLETSVSDLLTAVMVLWLQARKGRQCCLCLPLAHGPQSSWVTMMGLL